MKKRFLLTLAVLSLITVNSCKLESDDEPVPGKDVTAEKKDVKTFEIVNLIARENLASKYSGTFGAQAVELLKTSDSTLTFYVPDVPAGEAVLKFDLATIKYNVVKTQEVDPGQLISSLTQRFDQQVDLLNPSTPEEEAEVEGIKEYREEVLALFNSLNDDEKRQAVLFYEANKEVFRSFANSTFTNFDASTRMRLQSDCPRTDFKTFYGCTADNLGTAATDLMKASKEFLTMVTLAGISAYLAPASFGLSAFGTTLALGTAGYLLVTEVKPAVTHFKQSLTPFLKANWIFSKALFEVTVETFQDKTSTDINLTPKFRSITADDHDVTPGNGKFINAMTALTGYWNKLTSFFGVLPSYQNSEEATTLSTGEIQVSNISNPNVEYLGNTGQSLSFTSLSGKEETFSYKVRVTKEGFVEEKTLTAKVLASDPCVDGTMTAPVITNVSLVCNEDNQVAIRVSFTADGTGILTWGGTGSCALEATCYPVRLYFRQEGGSPDFALAANGYNVELISGNANAGVIELTMTWNAHCIDGKTAAQSLATHYANYDWRVELMNKCNQRSAQWEF